MGRAASCTGKGRMFHAHTLFEFDYTGPGSCTGSHKCKGEAVDRATPSHVLKFIALIVKGTGRVALDREPHLLDGI